MTPKNIEVINALSTHIVPKDERHLHLVQMAKALKPIPIAGKTDSELLFQVQNLVQIECISGFLPIWKGGKNPKVAWGDEPHLSLKEALGFKPAALAVRSPYFLTLDFDKPESLDFAAERGIDFTYPTWHIRRTDNVLRFKQVFIVEDAMLDELPNRSIERTINYLDSGLDIFLSNNSYIIFNGEHADGKGQYYSPKGLNISDMQLPPKVVWDLVLEIASYESFPRRRKRSISTKSKRMNPCIICGRDERLWCSESDNGLIFCMNGDTFNAEKIHGFLKIGDVTSNGYALVGQSPTCNTFKLDQPQKHKPRRTTKLRRSIRVKR